MKFSTAVAAVAASLPFAQAFHKGFNIGAQLPSGGCKMQADWAKNFQYMKALPGGFKDVRVYASSDCNTLQQAVPAAINNGIQIMVGVWAEDSTHYAEEKQALENAITAHGVKWISAVSVGSEDLYRGDTSASTLASQIYDVRGMISQPKFGGKGIWVGHVDTWTAWVNPANDAVIKACDFIGMDAYPYFQGSTIGDAKTTFFNALTATKQAIANNKPGTPVWITETGWPVAGPNDGSSVPSTANAQTYWHQVLCSVFPDYATYAYTLRDYYAAPANPSFGVLGYDFNPLYNLQC